MTAIDDHGRIWNPEEPAPRFCPIDGRALEAWEWEHVNGSGTTLELVCWQGWGAFRRRWELAVTGPFPQHYRYFLGNGEKPAHHAFDKQTGLPR